MGAVAVIATMAGSIASADAYDDAEMDSKTILQALQANASHLNGEIGSWSNTTGKTCDGLAFGLGTVKVMRTQSERANILKESADVGTDVRERYSEADRLGTPIFLDSYLNLADAYLAGHCLSEADAIYRDVIRGYTGSAYDAFRQRAGIGVDDVRSARQDAKAP